MKKDLFHNASLKLTSSYLLIIMAISLLFSISFYNVSLQEIERSSHRPPSGTITRIIGLQGNQDILEEYFEAQEAAAQIGKDRLRNNLVSLNILIFIGGGLLSYAFARRSLRPIEEAHKAQSRFISDASHELRTPITAMHVETEITLTEPKLTLAEAKKQLESNLEELDKLTSLSEGLLNLARLDNDALDLKETKIADIIDEAVSRVKAMADKKSQHISIGKIANIKLLADKPLLVESLVTLLDNAIKYSPEKSSIRIVISKSDKHILIDIQDEGIGMSKEELSHIFERFYRADQSRTKNMVNGYGIGLAIAKSTVEAHGGHITVRSTPNEGSTFTVQLPLS